MYGCGLAAVDAEANQPPVDGNGLVIVIPAVGGAGALPGANQTNGRPGGTIENGTGGGGVGNMTNTPTVPGAAGTCFAGGSGASATYSGSAPTPPEEYGGTGGTPASDGSCAGGGGGNPGGLSNPGGWAVTHGGNGNGGLLLVYCGCCLTIGTTGLVVCDGMPGGNATGGSGGGGSGGGVLCLFYGGELNSLGTLRANGGAAGTGYTPSINTGGPGGAGSVLGPHKIDPA